MAMIGFHGANTDIDTAAEALASTRKVLSGVVVKALSTNTGIVYVGNSSDVTASTGFPLSAGEQQAFDVAFCKVDDASVHTGDVANIYVIADAANQGVAYFGV